MHLIHVSDRYLRPSPARHRGLSFWGILFLVLLAALFIGARMLSDQTQREQSREFMEQMSDPETMLRSFFVQRSMDFPYKEDGWKILEEYVSSDDLAWLDQNKARLASLAPEMGILAAVASPDEQRYVALKAMLHFGSQASRPVISSIQESGDHAVAYVHPPNNIQRIQEIFLVSEGGIWKIRRFLGARDEYSVMDMLYESKYFNQEPLSPDEDAFGRDKQGYYEAKRRELLTEAGIPQTPRPTP